MNAAAAQLVFHGAIVLMIGLLCGAPYGKAINQGADEAKIHGWRVAHASLPAGAILMFAVAAILHVASGSMILKWLIALLFIVSSYAFAIALPVGAWRGERGLRSEASGWGRWVYVGNMAGATTSVIGTLALLIFAGAQL